MNAGRKAGRKGGKKEERQKEKRKKGVLYQILVVNESMINEDGRDV